MFKHDHNFGEAMGACSRSDNAERTAYVARRQQEATHEDDALFETLTA